MKLNYLLVLLLIMGCSKQSTESENAADTLQVSESEIVNDEPAEDGSNVLTSHDLILREVDEIDHDQFIKKTDYVYLFDGAVIPFTISYDEDERGIRWYRKAYYEIENESSNFAITYYFDREARLIFGRYIRSSTQDANTLILNISYSVDGEILHFLREDVSDKASDFSEEIDNNALYENFEGIFYFSDAHKIVSAPGMVEKQFYLGSREDYFDAGDGEIENADAPKSVRSEQGNTIYVYSDLKVKVNEGESGQTVSYSTNKAEPENKVPLPQNAYFKGTWGKALIFDVRGKSGMQLQVYDLAVKDFVLIREVANMKITEDKQFLVFTNKVTEKDIEFKPLCTPGSDEQKIGFLEVIHLDKNYSELRYGQVYCYLYRP